jgi:putative ABC transport system permease protein
MLNHLLKLIWNRKTANLLIITEVAITFIVLFALISMGRHFYQKYQIPLGYNTDNTWAIAFNTGTGWDNDIHAKQLKNVVEVLRQQPEISSVGVSGHPVLRNSEWTSVSEINGKRQVFNVFKVNDSGPKDWGVELVSGRWFSAQDNEQNYEAIMVNQLFADRIFGDKSAINAQIPFDGESDRNPRRIVGVFKDFRQRGDFAEPVPYAFYRYRFDIGGKYGVNNIHITFDKAQNAAYEGTLLKVLKGVTPGWSFDIRSWRSLRKSLNNRVLVPMFIVSIVVGFLLLMVAMGLLGVLWQNINQRTREIGLRRAVGASTMSIQGQIIGELVTLALFSMTLASLILLQVPLLNLVETVTWANFWFSLVSATVTILVIVILCALYPSRVAIKMAPALALHYE